MSSSPVVDNEPYPVDETITIIKGKTIYKNKKWWGAILLVSSFGHKKVLEYQWQMTEVKRKDSSSGLWIPTGQFKWKRKQKMSHNFPAQWELEKATLDEYMKEVNF